MCSSRFSFESALWILCSWRKSWDLSFGHYWPLTIGTCGDSSPGVDIQHKNMWEGQKVGNFIPVEGDKETKYCMYIIYEYVVSRLKCLRDNIGNLICRYYNIQSQASLPVALSEHFTPSSLIQDYTAHVGVDTTSRNEDECWLGCLLMSKDCHFYTYGNGLCQMGFIGDALESQPAAISGVSSMNWILGEEIRMEDWVR